MRFGLQTSLCNLCREVYNETKAEGFLSVFAVALLTEGVDRNNDETGAFTNDKESPSSRRAWIEITSFLASSMFDTVALLTEGVDRN